MGVLGKWESVGKAAFLRLSSEVEANAAALQQLVGGDTSQLTMPIPVTVDSENPIGPPPAPGP
jgi:hypothetical protein